MSLEGQLLDQKSLRAVTGKTADWNEIAKDCIAFANASGGRLLPRVEDGQDAPPSGQQIPTDLPDTVRRRILKPEIIDFIARADQTYQLTQRERITLGLLAQHDAMTARELAAALELSSVDVLQIWLKRLLEWGLVESAGRTQATRYFVAPGLLRSLNFSGETTLKRIEPHRLAALVLEDLQRYPESAIGDIHRRIGGEIHPKQVKRALEALIERGAVRFEGNNRWRRYWAVS